MFDRIAPRYDRLNRLLTLGLDRSWRRRALDAIAVGPGDTVLDLACGTGDLCELARTRGARVIGIDFAREMLRGAVGRGVRGSFVQGDAAALPLADACCDALLCGFALRNFVSLTDVAVEMARVLVPGGRIALIEVDRPRSRLPRAGHSLYFDRVVPRVGGWLSDREAYAYLPRSTVHLPAQPDLYALLQSAGFTELCKLRLLLGSAQIITGVRA
jgi:demethylmenaquinone methyltransferase/2-methoxy-6-polyprenyl-1,4-benzoquinol methylase